MIKHQTHGMDHTDEWLIDFIHADDEGNKITKRGLDATPLIVKKFDLGPKEVMAFTCHQRANKALTAFHFHPDFPLEDRRSYMREHGEGRDLTASIGSRLAAERARRRRMMEKGVTRAGRGFVLGLQSLAVFFAAGGPATR